MIKLLKLKKANNTNTLGECGEKRALKYLKQQKWKIIKTNYKVKLGEIDIIAEKANFLVAFEVKFRKDEEMLPYSIQKKQQTRIKNAILLFQQLNPKYLDKNIRFDAILLSNEKIEHIENAWLSY